LSSAAVLQVLSDDYRASRDNSLALSASESEPSANIHQTLRDFPEQKVVWMTRKNIRDELVHIGERRRIHLIEWRSAIFLRPRLRRC
jgi:hypothetical protein